MTVSQKRPAQKIIDGLKDAVRHAEGKLAVKTTRVVKGWAVMAGSYDPYPAFRMSRGNWKFMTERPAVLIIDMGKIRSTPSKRKQRRKK